MASSESRPHLFGMLAGLFLAGGLAFAALVLARTWVHLRESQFITVTGSSHANVRSDLVVWTAKLTVEDRTLAGAYARFKADFAQVRGFLAERGQGQLTLAPVQVKGLTRERKDEDGGAVAERVGYQLAQTIQISSPEVEAVPKLGAESLSLLAHGVILETQDMQFIYTKAGETKVQMMAEATADARRRAEEIAARGGRVVRELRAARMGVVQINPLYSSSTAWDGNNDTTSLDKTITATVTAEFTLR